MKTSRSFAFFKRVTAVLLCALIYFALASISGIGVSKIYANGDEGQNIIRVEYERESDCTFLAFNDGGSIRRICKATAFTDDNPEGEIREYTILDVEIVRQTNPQGQEINEEEEGSVVDLYSKGSGDKTRWTYSAQNAGDAVIKVTYLTIDNKEQSYQFTVHVVMEMYELSLSPSEGTYYAFPNSDVELQASARRQYLERHQYDDEDYEWLVESDEEIGDLTWEWESIGLDGSSIESSDGDATLHISNLPEGIDEQNVQVVARLKDDQNKVVAEESCTIRVAHNYYELFPIALDDDVRQMEVGEPKKVYAELRHYAFDQISDDNPEGYTLADSAGFTWDYDPGIISIKDSEGNEIVQERPAQEVGDIEYEYRTVSGNNLEFTITRLRDDFDGYESEGAPIIGLSACWIGSQGEELSSQREYELEFLNYQLYLSCSCVNPHSEYGSGLLYPDDDLTIEAVSDAFDLGDTSTYSVNFKVFTFNYDTDEIEEITGDGYYDIQGNTVILHGEKCHSDYEDIEIQVVAELYRGETRLKEIRKYVYLRENEEHFYEEAERDVLLGDFYYVNSANSFWADNKDYPGGTELSAVTKNCEIISNGEENEEVIELSDTGTEEWNGGRYYSFSTLACGEAVIRVTYDVYGYTEDYTNPIKENQTRDITIKVKSEIFYMSLESESGTTYGTAGSTINLKAEIDSRVQDGEPQSLDNVTYEWSIEDLDESIATIEENSEDSSRATVNLIELPKEEWVYFYVKAKAIKDGNVVAEETIEITFADSYIELTPTKINDLDLNEEVTITAAVKKYPENTNIPNVHFMWSYSPNQFEIRDANGQEIGYIGEDDYEYVDSEACYGDSATFTIKRIGLGEAECNLTAYWIAEIDGDEEEIENWKTYRFKATDEKNTCFDEIKSENLFSDEETTLTLNLDDFGGYQELKDQGFDVEFKVGSYVDPEGPGTEIYEEGVHYIVDKNTITLKGDALFRAQKGGQIYVDARVVNGRGLLAGITTVFNLREAIINVDGDHDRDMLPGWPEEFWGGRIEFETGKYNRDYWYDITDMTIVDAPENTGNNVIRIEKPQRDGDPYRIVAQNYGVTTVKMSYKVDEVLNYVTGESESFAGDVTFRINVSDVVWHLDIENEGSNRVLPGGTVNLQARVEKEDEEHGRVPIGEDEVRYEWTLEDWIADSEMATLNVDDNDSSKVSVLIGDVDDWNEFNFKVNIAIYDNEENLVKQDSYHIEVRSDYNEIWPIDIDSAMDVGTEQVVEPEVRHYPGDSNEYDVRNGVKYTWGFDENAVEISYNGSALTNGSQLDVVDPSQFTIKRIGNWNTTINLYAEWAEDCEWREYNLWDKYYDIWFEGANPWIVFTDGTKSITANIGGFDNYSDAQAAGFSLDFEVGFDYDFENSTWGTLFTKGQEYSVDENVVTVDGTKLDPEDDEQDVFVIARLKNGDDVLAEKDAHVYFKIAREEYNLQQNRSMLLNWDGWITGEGNDVWVENTAHPSGDNDKFTITDVELIEEHPHDSETTPVVEIEDPDQNGNWRYVARNYGDATIRITYIDLHGITKTHDFTVYVGGDVYNVNIEDLSGSYKARPGDTLTLVARVEHHSDDPERNGNIESVTYEWNVNDFNNGYGGNYATMSVNPSEPNKAILTFNNLEDMPQDIQEGHGCEVCPEIRIFDGQDEYGEPIERGWSDIRIWLSNEYFEAAPLNIDGRQQVGTTNTITAELHKVPGENGQPYDLMNAHFRWYYNPEAIEITDSKGNVVGNNYEGTEDYVDSNYSYGDEVEFHIKRLRNSNESINLHVDIRNESGDWEEVERREYWLDELDYNIWFDPDNKWSDCNTATTAFTLNKGGDVKEPFYISYEVGEWNGDANDWNKELEIGVDYTVIEDVVRITNSKALAKGINNVEIRAMLKSGDEVIADSWAWLTIEDHKWNAGTVTKDPTCSQVGVKTYTCSVCGANKIEDIPIDENAHDWDDGEITTPATCNTAGQKTYKCTHNEEHTRTEVVPIDDNAHDWHSVPNSAKDPTCTAPGKAADKKCSRCQEEIEGDTIPALNHAMTHHDAVAPTCEADGTVEYWSCSRCLKNFEDEAGTKELDSVVDPKTGHAMTHHAAVLPTCTSDGSIEYYACSNCHKNFEDEAGTKELDSIVDPKTGHAMTHHDAVAPTCEADGTVEYWSCSSCHKNFGDEAATTELDSLVASALGHDEEVIPAVDASCTTAGSTEGKKCTRCNEILVAPQEIPALGHDMQAVEGSAKEATCTEPGQEANKECSRCDHKESGAAIPATGHKWDAGAVTTAASYTAAGVKTYTCAVCKATKTEPIAQLQYPAGENPNQKSSDGTATGAGASAVAAESAITSSTSDEGPAGSKFAPLELKSTKQANTNITLSWKKPAGTAKLVIYGNACGKKNKMLKLGESTGKSLKVTKINGKALKKGTYHKFMVVALDAGNNVISSSKVIHVATKGGKKAGNPTKLTVKKPKTLKKGKKHKLAAKQTGKNVKKHRAICYESTNTKVATVDKKGVIKAVGKGTCYVYAYTQNGIFKKVKVKVK